jgi:hypothetical protein
LGNHGASETREQGISKKEEGEAPYEPGGISQMAEELNAHASRMTTADRHIEEQGDITKRKSMMPN